MNNSSLDAGLLVLRAAISVMILIHGGNKVFGAGGLAGTARWFESLGMRPAWLHARVAAATEIGAGLLLAAGLLMTLACAGIIGLMLVAAATDHRGKGFFVFKGGWEYVAFVGVVAYALACMGPGRWSIDRAAGIGLTGIGWASAGAVLAIVMAGLTLSVRQTQKGVPS